MKNYYSNDKALKGKLVYLASDVNNEIALLNSLICETNNINDKLLRHVDILQQQIVALKRENAKLRSRLNLAVDVELQDNYENLDNVIEFKKRE